MRNIIKTLKSTNPIIFSAVICTALIFYAYGCTPKTDSLLDPNKKVGAETLAAEFELIAAKYEKRLKDIEQQNQIRDIILQQSLTFASTGTINPIGIATTILSVLGIGFAADDVRLRKERKKKVARKTKPKTEDD